MQVTERNVLSSLNLSYFGLSEFFSCHILVGEKKMGMLLNAIQLGSTSLATKRSSQYVQNEGQARKCFRRPNWLNHEIS